MGWNVAVVCVHTKDGGGEERLRVRGHQRVYLSRCPRCWSRIPESHQKQTRWDQIWTGRPEYRTEDRETHVMYRPNPKKLLQTNRQQSKQTLKWRSRSEHQNPSLVLEVASIQHHNPGQQRTETGNNNYYNPKHNKHNKNIIIYVSLWSFIGANCLPHSSFLYSMKK